MKKKDQKEKKTGLKGFYNHFSYFARNEDNSRIIASFCLDLNSNNTIDIYEEDDNIDMPNLNTIMWVLCNTKLYDNR